MLAAMNTKGHKTVGVLGGMGPAATVDFMSSVISLTSAEKDQDHLHMIVDHNPQVPDRQAALSGDRAAVQEALTVMAKRLEAAGADFLVMPCNTAHVFVAKAEAAVSIPLINIINETVNAIDAQAETVGILATTACLESEIYQSAIEISGRRSMLPGPAEQDELVQLIFRIKSGEVGEGVRHSMMRLAQALVDGGAAAIIAGCTEIPIVLGQSDVSVPLISSTGILAQRTIEFANEQ
jgi:aspartate racemase